MSGSPYVSFLVLDAAPEAVERYERLSGEAVDFVVASGVDQALELLDLTEFDRILVPADAAVDGLWLRALLGPDPARRPPIDFLPARTAATGLTP